MKIFEKLKGLFVRSDMPDETRSLFDNATTTRDLLQGLDELLTRNELEFNELNREIAQLEEIEQEEIHKVRSGQLNTRVKQNTLLYIKRLRKQMDNLQNRLYIYDKNINLHINLIAKIQDMEAMALKGVEEKEIDSIVVEFQTNFEKYMNTVIAAEAAEEYSQSLAPSESAELQSLEDEILAEVPPVELVEEEETQEPAEQTKSPSPAELRDKVERELDEEEFLEDDEEEFLEDDEEEPEIPEEPSKKRLLEMD